MKRKIFKLNKKILLVLGLISTITTSTFSTSYYVATNGSNSNAGTLASPWKTLSYSVGRLIAGDILFVMGGTYVESVNITNSGTATAPITISAFTGESPVIDGQNIYPTSNWGALVNLAGSYIYFSGFEVKNSSNLNARGIILNGDHGKVSLCNVHHTYQNGILISGDYGIVEDSKVWQSCLNNSTATATIWASGLSAARDPINGITDNAIIRRNVVYNNWGEGLSTYEANGTIIEDNIVYDNWAQILYISDASNVICRRNLFYNSSSYTSGRYIPVSASLADEVSTLPRSTNNQIINNLFLNTPFKAFYWTIVPGSGLTNALIANNTFVNSPIFTGTINSGNNIKNNIFTTSSTINSTSGITWSNNLWQSTQPTNAIGTNDVLGDPLLMLTGSTNPGELTGSYFKFYPSSPAINKALVVTEVTDDFFKNVRSSSPDIGGFESSNLLLNPGFENGTTSWTASGGTIAATTPGYSGTNSCSITARTLYYAGPNQVVTTAVAVKGSGTYYIEFWAKMASGSSTVYGTLKYQYYNTWYYPSISATVGTTWTKVSGTVPIVYTGTLQNATFYLQTPSSILTDFYADNCILTFGDETQLLTNSASALSYIEKSNLLAYPNPSTHTLMLEMPSFNTPEKVQIVSLTGKVIKEIYLSSSIGQINVEDLDNGLYFVRYKNSTIKLIKN